MWCQIISSSSQTAISPCDDYLPVTIFCLCPEVVIISDILCRHKPCWAMPLIFLSGPALKQISVVGKLGKICKKRHFVVTLDRSIGRGDCIDEDDLVTTGGAGATRTASMGDSASGNRNSKGIKVRKRTKVRWKEYCAKKVSTVETAYKVTGYKVKPLIK